MIQTMMCLILDRSGSMQGRETDVVGGVNKFLEEQKALPDSAALAMVRFDTEAIERFRPMRQLSEVQPLTLKEYEPRGGTPLLDAIGFTLVALDEDWAREQPERGILMIVTDGAENASKEFTKAKIKEMIEARQDSGKWAIIYLGANVDAFAEAGSMGVSMANTAGYQNTHMGTQTMYASASAAVGGMRVNKTTVAHNLGRNLGEQDDPNKVTQATPTPPPASSAKVGSKTKWRPPTP